ncbi:hypothetical protein QIS74_12628 [Colletotrichum tabaci]|uniref:Uncharacterized protein n=1 Tax=Colletotrichum tabaci TaxID=1209068 RepID=A0AAV9SX13_9PEZI
MHLARPLFLLSLLALAAATPAPTSTPPADGDGDDEVFCPGDTIACGPFCVQATHHLRPDKEGWLPQPAKQQQILTFLILILILASGHPIPLVVNPTAIHHVSLPGHNGLIHSNADADDPEAAIICRLAADVDGRGATANVRLQGAHR